MLMHFGVAVFTLCGMLLFSSIRWSIPYDRDIYILQSLSRWFGHSHLSQLLTMQPKCRAVFPSTPPTRLRSDPWPKLKSQTGLSLRVILQQIERKRQMVLAYCSKSMNASNSGCADVFNGGPEHTIVQMPQSCGLGPFARIVSMGPYANQSIHSEYDEAQKPVEELVYSLTFDYNFSAIPVSNRPMYMRVDHDVANIPGYWDQVMDSPPEPKRWI